MVLAVLGLAVLPAPAQATNRPGPCDVHRHEGEPLRSWSRRLIRCAAERWEVPGGPEKAICIADAESGLDPEASSAHHEYLGLFQHSAEAWPERYDAWTRTGWALDETALSGRTNAIVTMRMVNASGWGAWEDVGDC
jgi:hypothetical protein